MTPAEPSQDVRKALQELAAWRAKYLTGDEKSEAQIFLERLFQAMGHKGIAEAGAKLEYRLKKNDDKGTSFADLVYKPHCLIEMKKSGTELWKHYRQALGYWTIAVPDRPRYVVLCNFDEFWVYDFNRQVDQPVDRIALDKLADRREALSFLLPTPQTPIFNNDLEKVTRKAASKVAAVFRSMYRRGVPRVEAQRFTLQSVMAMFAEDIDLLPSKFFTRALKDSNTGAEAFDLIFGLFQQMNTPGITAGGRYKGTAYFNGGLFANIHPVELTMDEVLLLREAAAENWAGVQPEIFGTLFEGSMDEGERHAHGAHFTSQADITKIVEPTIVAPWRKRIENARTLKDYNKILGDMYSFRVLDPACGSGNFLYVAYREMRRLEHEVLDRMRERSRTRQGAIAYVTPDHFYGIDMNGYAVEVAKVTLLLAKKLAADELGDSQPVLPLDNLDASIRQADALFSPWPKADAIIGNPPFLGRRRLVEELGVEYSSRLAEAYPAIGGVSDFVCYWFPKTNDHLPEGGRAGLVGTKSIKQGQSREVSLDYVVDHGGVITEAVSLQPWSGEASVSVSIVNWQKGGETPTEKILWTDNGNMRSVVPAISSSLSLRLDLRSAHELTCNMVPKRVFQGQTPGVVDAFTFARADADADLKVDWDVVHPLLGGKKLLHETSIDRFVLDVPESDAGQAWLKHPKAMKFLETRALPVRQKTADEQERKNEEALASNPKSRVNWHHRNFLASWWRLAYRREDMLAAKHDVDRYIAITRTSSEKRGPIFTFVDSSVNIEDSAVGLMFSDDYSFGILQSSVHVDWFRERCTTLETRLTYTTGTVFNSFPWPQNPDPSEASAVAECGSAIIDHRAAMLEQGQSLSAIYDVLRKPGKSKLRDLHQTLDEAVRKVYGFSSEEDVLAALLVLNADISSKIERGEPVTGPGTPMDGLRISSWRLTAEPAFNH